MMDWLRNLRAISMVFLMGAATGAYGEWKYSHGISDDIQARMVDGGWCAQTDPRGVVYLFACRDSYIAAELSQRAIAQDQETAAILSQMESANAKRSRGKGQKP